MDLILVHKWPLATGIFGEIFDKDGMHFMFTGTHAYPDETGKLVPKLPPGNYKCVRGTHTLEHYNEGKPFETFEITNVPGHSKMLIHPGNFPQKESDGCQLTGEGLGNTLTPGGKMLCRSDMAFNRFIEAQKGTDVFNLLVENC